MQKKIGAYFLTILLLLHFGIESIASTPCFTASALKGCVPFTLTLDASCGVPFSATPNYFYDFLNNSSPGASTPSNTHIFTTPGTYRVVQFIGPVSNNRYIDILVTASPDPIFTVKSCAGSNITLTMAATSPPTSIYDNYDINWGDGSLIQNAAPASATTHQFITNGIKSITVTGKYLPNAACGSKTVTSYAIQTLLKPDLTQVKVDAQHASSGRIIVSYNSTNSQKYRIERSTNGGAYTIIYTPVTNIAGIVNYTDQNRDTQTEIYTYQVVTFDDCGLEVPSDPIYSIIIKATPTNGLNTVTWNTDPKVNNFTLTKNTVPQNFSNTTTSFLDNAIVCGSSYCYSNTASLKTLTLSGNPQKSISIDTCITAISTTIPPAPQDLNSTMNGSNATISWTSAGTNVSYKLHESIIPNPYSVLTQQTATSYSYNLNLTSNYCYQLDYSDLCGNPSPKSLTTCPVIVEGTISGTTITLNWNAYTGFNNTGVQSYAVQKLDQNGTVLSETNVGSSTSFSQTVNLTDPYINYRIKVIPNIGTFTNSFSNNSLFKFEAEVFVPDIFTPNGDNTNDNFIVKGRYVNSYSISIFSRWGEVVYASTDILVGWDGFNNFVYAPEGAYTYKIIATDIHNKEFTKTGTVTLTR